MTSSDQTWTVKAILDWCEGYLASKGDTNPRLSAQWLLGEAMGLSRIELYTNLDKLLSEEERTRMRAWVQRRGAGEPLQLICGTAPFRHMVLEVAPGVLIPRPETEVLISEVLAAFPAPKQISAYAFEDEAVVIPKADDNVEASEIGESVESRDDVKLDQSIGGAEEASKAIRVVDLCTGSGCIACALATEHPTMELFALDIAPEALVLAQRNVDVQGVADRVRVIKSDLLSALVADPVNKGTFDAIVSNPPYIPSAVVDALDAEVSEYEPRLALDGGSDGLDLFRRFIDDAHTLLKPGGILAVELFEESLEEAAQIAQSHNFTEPRILSDLSQRPRILLATR